MEQPGVMNENHHVVIDMPSSSSGSSSSETDSAPTSSGSSSSSENGQPSSGVLSCSFPVSPKYLLLAFNIIMFCSSVTVLHLSRHEKPLESLHAWIVGYTVACAVNIPIIFRNYYLLRPSSWSYFLEILSAWWFLVGNWCIFAQSSYSDAHTMYWFGVALLVLDYIKYTPVVIIWAIHLSRSNHPGGFLLQEDGGPAASTESINALPTYKFNKLQGGLVAAAGGTEKEGRSVPGEDAVCCICIGDYCYDDVVKELPCTHLFHASCVDEWLKIKAFCPLCKRSIIREEETQAANQQASSME